MNPKSESVEASRGSEASSSSINSTPDIVEDQLTSGNIMKRAAAKQLIEKYFYQLLDGCGNVNCDNRYCASSGAARNLSPNEAAAEAIKLFYKEARLCSSVTPNKVSRTDSNSYEPSPSSTLGPNHKNTSENKENQNITTPEPSTASRGEPHTSHTAQQQKQKKRKRYNNGAPLTEERIYKLCDECLQNRAEEPLSKALSKAFSRPSILARCFASKISENANETSKDTEKESKESSRSCDPDKDIDSVAAPQLDVASCRRAFQYLAKVPTEYYSTDLVIALKSLGSYLSKDLKSEKLSIEDAVNCFVITFELPNLGCSDYFEIALPDVCLAIGELPIKGQARLARIWSQYCKDSLRNILETLQQLISLRVVSCNYHVFFHVQEDGHVTGPTRVLKVLYYASILAGVLDSNTLHEEPIVIAHQHDPLESVLGHLYPPSSMKGARNSQLNDPLAVELGVSVLDSRAPYLPFEDFYNEPLSDVIEMDKDCEDYEMVISRPNTRFSFLRHPFVLTVASKSLGLYYENRLRMYSESRAALLQAAVGAARPEPFLRLRVRRSHLIEDALVVLEMISMERALDLKKQLVVEFEGEQGVDEGGVSKEFFQLIVEEIFNPDYGMFTHQQDSRNVWFNPTSFETEAQFTLIGIVLGLAIYNNVILAVNFPMVVYRKLLGRKGSFEDLVDWNPILYNGLKDMLEYTGDDLEEVYYQTFRICYQDVFGTNMFHELKVNGDNIFVTQENKKEFVDLYADFLLNVSVETQFRAFRRGFLMVTDESPLGAFFRPEEVEMLVCGSKVFDFHELEKSTEYDGGYASDSKIVQDFWGIVHSLPLEDKRKLLQFTTGSDRVPVGGLCNLNFVIARNGPDCDRLPTAHTCFNVLLLPEYDTRDKLQDRLLKAINYSKGFGLH